MARISAGQDEPRIVHHGTLEALHQDGERAGGRGGEPERDLIWRGVLAACDAAGRPAPRGVVIEASSEVPVGRGLGSSAAAVVSGIVAASVLCGFDLDAQAIATIGTSLEGHPDNVAAAVFGGAVLSLASLQRPLVIAPLIMHESIALAFAVPDFTLATREARAALPAVVPHSIAVSAAARSAALIQGLATGAGALLAPALDDVLHVPYRRTLVRGYDTVVASAVSAGAFGATLSGAGSGIVAIAPAGAAARVAAAMAAAWREHGITATAFVGQGRVPGYEVRQSGDTSARLRRAEGHSGADAGGPLGGGRNINGGVGVRGTRPD